MMTLRTLGSTLLWAAMAASPLSAQTPRASPADSTLRAAPPSADVTQVNRLLGTLMSPFCPGLTLATCPSVYAETLRVSVRGRLDAGETPDSIVESLVAAFGEGVRGAPRAAGLGLVLWGLPIVVLGAGGMAVLWWLRSRGVGAPVASTRLGGGGAGSMLTPASVARLEAELRTLE